MQYYDLILAQAKVAVARQAVAEAEEALRLTAIRTRAGTGLAADELRSKAFLAGRQQDLILALNATVDGQTTAHYIADRAAPTGARISRLAQGVPIGGELDYLDEGTLTAALRARREI